jgi:hypothetical protein
MRTGEAFYICNPSDMTISRCRWRGFVRYQAILAVGWDLQKVGLVYRIDWRAKSMHGKAPGGSQTQRMLLHQPREHEERKKSSFLKT